MDDSKNEQRAILKGGCYSLVLALALLALSVALAFIDKILGL